MQEMYTQEREIVSSKPQRFAARFDSDSVILCMPAYSFRLNRYTTKIVSEFKNNPKKYSLPVQGGLIILIDSRNSSVLAVFDSQAITEIRTGAVSGLATKLLAQPNCETVGVIGSGAEARRLLEAVAVARNSVRRAKVYSLHASNAQKFAEEMTKKLGLDVVAEQERRAAVSNADVLIVATNSKTPVTNWKEIPPGCHVNSIGAYQNELDEDTIVHSKLFVDTKEGVLEEAKDVNDAIQNSKISKDHIQADLSELLLGLKKGRTEEQEVTLFKSVGIGLQDVYACNFVYDKISKA